MNETRKKYEVTVLEKKGACDNSLFEKMAKRGDITAEKVAENIDRIYKITGYAKCKIVTDEKDFILHYFVTNDGIISSGSEIFYESVVDYIDDVQVFKIVKIKTKKGITYKAVPMLDYIISEEVETKKDNNEEITEDEEGAF